MHRSTLAYNNQYSKVVREREVAEVAWKNRQQASYAMERDGLVIVSEQIFSSPERPRTKQEDTVVRNIG
ncbi:hypothetical protein JCM11641_002548 [Rhodosporidiobolus odoratus]